MGRLSRNCSPSAAWWDSHVSTRSLRRDTNAARHVPYVVHGLPAADETAGNDGGALQVALGFAEDTDGLVVTVVGGLLLLPLPLVLHAAAPCQGHQLLRLCASPGIAVRRGV